MYRLSRLKGWIDSRLPHDPPARQPSFSVPNEEPVATSTTSIATSTASTRVSIPPDTSTNQIISLLFEHVFDPDVLIPSSAIKKNASTRSLKEIPKLYFQELTTKRYMTIDAKSHHVLLTPKAEEAVPFVLIKVKPDDTSTRTLYALQWPQDTSPRYLGHNLVNKVTCSAKSMHAWERFQVFQDVDPSEAASESVCLFLGSARFGRGAWLAERKGRLGLDKHYESALQLRYAKDLADFEPKKQAPEEEVQKERSEKGFELELPWNCTDNFLEILPEDQTKMSEFVLDMNLHHFFDMWIEDTEVAMQRHENDGNSDVILTKWHRHPQLNLFVRKHEFKTFVGGIASIGTTEMCEYESYRYTTPDKTQLEYCVKTFVRGVPYGGSFTIETRYVLATLQPEVGTMRLLMTCFCGIPFSRSTMFKRQITKGCYDGVRTSSEKLASLLNEHANSLELHRLSHATLATIVQSIDEKLDVDEEDVDIDDDRDDRADELTRIKTIHLPWISDGRMSSFVNHDSAFFETPELEFSSVFHGALNVTPSEYFSEYLSDKSIFYRPRQLEDEEYQISPWQHSTAFGHLRKQQYFASSSDQENMVEEYQFYTLNAKGSVLEYGTKVLLQHHKFSIETKYTIELVKRRRNPAPNCTEMKCLINVVFKEPTRRKREITTTVTKTMHKLLEEHVAAVQKCHSNSNAMNPSGFRSLFNRTTSSSYLVVQAVEVSKH